MTFVSYEFIGFMGAALAIYYGCRQRFRVAVLFAASAVFLWFSGGPESLAAYGFSAVTIWAGALGIESSRKRAAVIYWCIFTLNLALLALFQYVNFFGYTMKEIHWLMGTEWEWEPVSLIAPVAVSFYTLTLTGYLTEVYWGALPAEKSLVRLGLFGGFFPQMAMGPIARYDRLAPSLFAGSAFDKENLFQGFSRILWGLFEKLVISERLAMIVNTVYGDYQTYTGSFLVFGAVCFAFRLYTDFAGAIDIASGCARMFGVKLEENFRQPFYSRTVAEFWRRWHITLGGWFKDFLMYPMLKTAGFQSLGAWGKKRFGKKQGKKIPVIGALLIVWFLLGLWHGGKWTFIIGSGLYHGVLMSLALAAEPAAKKFYKNTGIRQDHPLWILFQRARTFVLVGAGFVLFRSDSLEMAWGIFSNMFSGDMGLFSGEGIRSVGLLPADLAVLAAAMAVLWLVSYKKEHGGEDAFNRSFTQIRILALLSAVLIFGWYGKGYDPSAFIYAQF